MSRVLQLVVHLVPPERDLDADEAEVVVTDVRLPARVEGGMDQGAAAGHLGDGVVVALREQGETRLRSESWLRSSRPRVGLGVRVLTAISPVAPSRCLSTTTPSSDMSNLPRDWFRDGIERNTGLTPRVLAVAPTGPHRPCHLATSAGWRVFRPKPSPLLMLPAVYTRGLSAGHPFAGAVPAHAALVRRLSVRPSPPSVASREGWVPSAPSPPGAARAVSRQGEQWAQFRRRAGCALPDGACASQEVFPRPAAWR